MKKKNITVMVCLLFFIFLVAGCWTHSSEKGALPTHARLISDEGNGWVIFELDGKQFLYCKQTGGEAGFMALTQIHQCQCDLK